MFSKDSVDAMEGGPLRYPIYLKIFWKVSHIQYPPIRPISVDFTSPYP